MTNENVWRVAKRTSEGRGRQTRSLAHAAGYPRSGERGYERSRSVAHAVGFRNAKMLGGLGGVYGLALFLGKYAVFQTAARPPSGGVEGGQRSGDVEITNFKMQITNKDQIPWEETTDHTDDTDKKKRWPRKAQKDTRRER